MNAEKFNLQDWQLHFTNIYELNNHHFLQTRSDRIMWLGTAVRDLKVAIRQQPDNIERDLARIPPRIFAVANTVDGSVANGMMRKYPIEGCSYCQSSPCQCNGSHKEAQLVVVDSSSLQAKWGIQDWQNHIDEVYGLVNRQKGLEASLGHLFEEVFELVEVEHDDIRRNTVTEQNKVYFEGELADCLAWTLASANLTGIDLEGALKKRYADGCWRCGGKSCSCGDVNFKEIVA